MTCSTELLGVGDFYYELGVQIIEAGLRTRASNGGLMEVPDLLAYLEKVRGKQRRKEQQAVSGDDVERAVQKLAILGGGVRVLAIGKRKFVQLVPVELDNDHAAVLNAAQESGWVTKSSLAKTLGWNDVRIEKVLQPFLREGMAWVDDHQGERQYWFPSLLHMFAM